MTTGPRTVFITGGTRGIGWGVTEAMLAAGYTVTVTGLREAEVAAVPALPGLSARQLDVTDDAEVAAVFAGVERLDALVNCAGIILRGAEYDIAAFQKVIDVNLTGTMRMCLAARPALAASGKGSIINMASMLSFFGGGAVPAYAASKGGIAQLTKSLAIAWARDDIRVNAIAPGWIETDLTRPLVDDPTRSATILARTPMHRWGQPSDIGGSVVYLCSEAARFVTGVVLPVDGGYAVM